MRTIRLSTLLIFLMVSLSLSAQKNKTRRGSTAPRITASEMVSKTKSSSTTTTKTTSTKGHKTTGKASYYAKKFHGRLMSNGRPYHNEKMTCAHRRYPFGTKLKVRNPRNGREVIVEVTDRGPFAKGRIIDLSYAAARQLGMLAAGVVTVEVSVVGNDVKIPYREPVAQKLPELDFGFITISDDSLDIIEEDWMRQQKGNQQMSHRGHNSTVDKKSLEEQFQINSDEEVIIVDDEELAKEN